MVGIMKNYFCIFFFAIESVYYNALIISTAEKTIVVFKSITAIVKDGHCRGAYSEQITFPYGRGGIV